MFPVHLQTHGNERCFAITIVKRLDAKFLGYAHTLKLIVLGSLIVLLIQQIWFSLEVKKLNIVYTVECVCVNKEARLSNR